MLCMYIYTYIHACSTLYVCTSICIAIPIYTGMYVCTNNYDYLNNLRLNCLLADIDRESCLPT